MTLSLPTKKTLALTDLSKYTLLIYGSPKVGKSTFCSQLDKPLFMATEPGLNALDTHQVSITSWKEFTSYCTLIASGKHDFKTIVVDTIDNLLKMCATHICKEKGVSHESDIPMSKGYSLVNSEFARVITKLASLPTGLILVSHAKQVKIDERTGDYMRMTATLTGKQRDFVFGFVDMILYFDTIVKTIEDKETEIRVIKTKPSKFWDAGERTGNMSAMIKMDVSAFESAFKKALLPQEKVKEEKEIEKKQTEDKPQIEKEIKKEIKK